MKLKILTGFVTVIMILSILLTLISCAESKELQEESESNADKTSKSESTTSAGVDSQTISYEQITSFEYETVFEYETMDVSEGEYSGKYSANITLSDSDSSVEGSGATVSGSDILIESQGTYVLSGKLSDGQIIVNTTNEEKVKLILNGVDIVCSDGPAVYVKSAPKKVILYTAKDSVNSLSDGSVNYIVADEQQVEGNDYPDAAVYSKDDLKLDGDGKLYVTGNQAGGITCKDDLEICGGEIYITSVKNACKGKDSVTINGGKLTVNAGNDGIKSTNAEDEGKGNIEISGGEIYLSVKADGISCEKNLTVSGGTIAITTEGEFTATSSSKSSTTGGRGPGGGGFGGMQDGNSNKSSISAKGLKAGSTLTISGNTTISIESADDGLHSGDAVVIDGGSLYISSNDDGIHADKTLTVNGGNINIAKSYEGLEAAVITVNDGVVRVKASDDGFNASDGTTQQMGGGPGGFGGFGGRGGSQSSTTSIYLYFNGGYVYVDASGDGIDSNGNIVMTGGTVIIMGPTDNGNGAIDFGDSNNNMTISGGILMAAGSSGMAETATNNGQAVISLTTRSTLSANCVIVVSDSNGNIVAVIQPSKKFASIVFSCPELVSGNKYTISYNATAESEITDGVLIGGSASGGKTLGTLTAS